MKKSNKVIVILGPTASGKSELAVYIAKKYNGEIISADSRQVYRGLNIGTGKITKKETRGIPHFMLDVANPKKRFTVVNYQEMARKNLQEIFSRKHLPIICGGTGFYISSLIEDTIFPNVPPNKKLREELNKLDTEKLFTKLKKLDPIRAEKIDPKNKRRIIRAIEIALVLGKVPSIKNILPSFETLKIGTKIAPEMLRQKIHIRLLNRIKQGMISEVKKLHVKGLSWKRMEELGLEYRYLARYLTGKISKEEMLKQLETEIWHYAKRQMTWFRKDKDTHWLDPNNIKNIEKTIKNFLNFKESARILTS